MKLPKRRLVVLAVLAAVGAGFFHMTSDRRDLEVALGVNRVPGSLREVEIKTDIWTDYSVYARFRIKPEDLAQLLSARSYEEVKVPEILGLNIRQFRPPPSDMFPQSPPVEVMNLFEWEREAPFARCQIWVNGDLSAGYIQYSTD